MGNFDFEDTFDKKIIHTLWDNPAGLGFLELKAKTDMNSKTLNSHLQRLEKNEIISKTKRGTSQNSPTTYRVNIDENRKKIIDFTIPSVFDGVNELKKFPTKKRREMLIYYLQQISQVYFTLLYNGLTNETGFLEFKIASDIMMKKIQNLFNTFKNDFTNLKSNFLFYDNCYHFYLMEVVKMEILKTKVEKEVNTQRGFKEIFNDIMSINERELLEKMQNEIKDFNNKVESDENLNELFGGILKGESLARKKYS